MPWSPPPCDPVSDLPASDPASEAPPTELAASDAESGWRDILTIVRRLLKEREREILQVLASLIRHDHLCWA